MKIETPRLILRPMVADDAMPLLALFGDPAFMAAFDAPAFGLDDMRAWVERNLAHQGRHGFGLWTIVEKATGEVIGDCGFEVMDVEGETVAELGYDLRRDRWGCGYATEAARAASDHGRRVLRLDRIVSLVREGNVRSARVAERLGMRLDGTVERDGIRYRRYRRGSS